MTAVEKWNEGVSRIADKAGMAVTIMMQGDYVLKDTKERFRGLCPFRSFIASFIASFSLGIFANTYTVNSWLEFFNSPYHIHWILGGVLAVIPKIGKFTILLWILTFICINLIERV